MCYLFVLNQIFLCNTGHLSLEIRCCCASFLLKPSQNKKDQKKFPAAPFLNTFSQLPAVKKYSKNGAVGNFFGPSYFDPALVKFPFKLTLFNLWSNPVCSIGCTPIKFQNPILVKTNKHFSYQSNPGGGFYPSRRSSLATGSISDLAKPTNWVFVLPYLLVHLSILMCN